MFHSLTGKGSGHTREMQQNQIGCQSGRLDSALGSAFRSEQERGQRRARLQNYYGVIRNN